MKSFRFLNTYPFLFPILDLLGFSSSSYFAVLLTLSLTHMASLLRRHLDPVGCSSTFPAGEDRDGVTMTAVGQDSDLACRDDPHPRHLCSVFPFTQTSHASYCNLCHCYACEIPAPCFLWFYHCHATDEDEHSKILRSSVEQNSMVPPYLPESELISSGTSSAFSKLVVADQICVRASSIMRINRICKKRSSTKTNRRRRLSSWSRVKRMPTDSEADGLATQIITYSRRYKQRASTPTAVINMKQTRNALSTDRRHSIIDWKQWRDLVADRTCETDKDDKDESYQQVLKRFRLVDMPPRHSNSDTDENYLRLIRRFGLMELSARRSTSEKTVDMDGNHSKSII